MPVIKLNERAEQLLRTLVELHVSDGQPVGSRTLAKYTNLNISPATVRNVMADLEDLGLIRAPHTSSGRIPTQQGYRFFIDTLLNIKPLDAGSVEKLQEQLGAERDPQLLLSRVSEVLANVTSFAGVVLIANQHDACLKQVEFLQLSRDRILAILVTEDGRVQNRVIPVDREYSPGELVEAANYFNHTYKGFVLGDVRRKLLEEVQADTTEIQRITRTAYSMASKLLDNDAGDEEEMLLSGEEKLLSVPDLCEIDTLQQLFDAFKTKNDLLDLLDRSMRVNGINIFIGEESGYEALNNCSVITAPYEADGKVVGTLGVIGPTRMRYGTVIPVVDVTAKLLSGALSHDKGSAAST
ncbi:MAG: heat-inducible transcriptional repressor HrcA [Gammaproteobacteria bacterium]|nr:heat-inducible transcriptional repressor HrcA [Gammaproteobacteria bacterium]